MMLVPMSKEEIQNQILPIAKGQKSLVLQFVVVGSGSLAIILLNLVFTRICAVRFGPIVLSEILVFRTYGMFLTALGTLGMPISLQRNVAFFHKEPERANTTAWLGLGIGTFLLAIICTAAVLLEP